MFAKSFEILGHIEFFLGQNTISNVKAARICYSGNLSVPTRWIWLIKCISAAFSLQNTEDPFSEDSYYAWPQDEQCLPRDFSGQKTTSHSCLHPIFWSASTSTQGNSARVSQQLEVRRSHVALSSQLSGCQSCPLAMARAGSALPRRLMHSITRWHYTQIKEINP